MDLLGDYDGGKNLWATVYSNRILKKQREQKLEKKNEKSEYVRTMGKLQMV